MEPAARRGVPLATLHTEPSYTRRMEIYLVGGSVRVVGLASRLVRLFQSGHIYHYAFTMIFGVCALLSFWLLRA